LFSFVPLSAQFADNFSDGNFTENPVWNGTAEKFTVNNNVELQLNDQTASGTALKAYLSTPSTAVMNGVWTCKAQINTQVTSSNYARFYLISNSEDLTASLQGYYIAIGYKNKTVSLYKQNGAAAGTELFSGSRENILGTSANSVIVKAERDFSGNWKLFSKLDTDEDFVLEGEIFDNSYTTALFSGIYVYYSSGNKDKYFFDDFLVSGENYVASIYDYNSVIINEIMADYEPQAGLPNAEYIELYNRTESAVNLAGWQILCGNNVGAIVQGEIAPYGYIILCAANARENFVPFGNAAQVTSFPTLPNSAGLLVLKTPDNQTINFTEYSDKWFKNDNFRKEGGFSLEKIDTENLNNSGENWYPSHDDLGGTPCRKNSVAAEKPDKIQPEVKAVSLLSDNSVALIFNKEMNVESLENMQNYFSDDVNIISATVESPKNERVTLTFSPTLENDTVRITAKNLMCISGFDIVAFFDDYLLSEFSFKIAKPQEVEANELIINELLFNTKDSISTFAELFNASEKVLDLSKIDITRRNKEGELDAPKKITQDGILLFPKQYLLLSANLKSICENYHCGEGLKIECALPSMPNAEGTFVVAKPNAEIIDEFSYSEKMHQNFVVNPSGVSLERINPYAPTQDVNNWHSASFDENYATPARQNSQYFVPKTVSEKNFWLEYETFTPDNDGFRDFLLLNYSLSESGFALSATVYDAVGHKMRALCNNAIASRGGTLIWNGLADNNSLCPVGVYVLVVEAVNTCNGKKNQAKIVCVLSMK
jgi:hypothetical protein